MGTSYTAYTFIGSEVPESAFFTLKGDGVMSCESHGAQDGKYCNECGGRLEEAFDYEWTAGMQQAADHFKTTPEALWEKMTDDGDGLYWGSDREIVGLWKYGYECDQALFGKPLARAESDGRHSNANDTVPVNRVRERIAEVEDAFKLFGIKKIVNVIAVQDCG